MQQACVGQHAVGAGRVRCRRISPGDKPDQHSQPVRVGDAELLVSPMGRGVLQDGSGSVDRYVLAGSLRTGEVTVSRRSGEYLDLVNVRNGEVADFALVVVEFQGLNRSTSVAR
jgi:hypothetical protein